MCGLPFKGFSNIPVHQIHLHGKMTHYGTKITYIYVGTGVDPGFNASTTHQ
jgi:hypothetical protein